MNDYIIYHANNFSTAGDGFTEVAVVSAYNMSNAFRLSNNIESSWIENPEVLLQCELPEGQDGLRSTSSGDVIFDPTDEKFYFLVPMGYENSGDTVPVDNFNLDGFLDFESNGVLYKEDGFYNERCKEVA